MMKVAKIVATMVFAVVLAMTFAACAPQERMDAYVRLAHPQAWTIDRVNGQKDDIQAYILCENGTVRVIMATHAFSADIMNDVELDKNRVSCN